MSRMTTGVTGDEIEVTRAAPDRVRLEVSGEEIALSLEDAEMLSALLKQALARPEMDEFQPCLMASGICPRHARVHGWEAEELRAGVEALMREHDRKVPARALQRLLDKVDARDSLAFVEACDAKRDELAKLKQEQEDCEHAFQQADAGRESLRVQVARLKAELEPVPYREGLPGVDMVRAHAERFELSGFFGGRWQVINDGEFLMLDLAEKDGVITATLSGVTGEPFDISELCDDGPGQAVFRPTDPNATPHPWPEVAS